MGYPGQFIRVPDSSFSKPSPGTKSSALMTDERVRKRYFDELAAIDANSSEDENYPVGPPASLSKKQRRHLSSIQASLGSEFKPIQSTLTQHIYNKLVVVDGKAEKGDEESARPKTSCHGNDVKKTLSEHLKKGGELRRNVEPAVLDVLSRVSGSKNVYDINEEMYKSFLIRHYALKKGKK